MNTKAMFEALLKIIDVIDCRKNIGQSMMTANDVLYYIRDEAQKALMTKPRNSDIGNTEERNRRFSEFCRTYSCIQCPIFNRTLGNIKCAIVWEDKEYEGAIK